MTRLRVKKYKLLSGILLTSVLLLALIGSESLSETLTALLPTINADFLVGSFVVGFTLTIALIVVWLYPHLFSIRTFRIPGFFVLSYSFIILLPLPRVYASHQSSPNREVFLFAVIVSFLCTIAGIILMQEWLPSSPLTVRGWLIAPIRITKIFRLSSLVLLAICLIIFLLYIRQVGTLPIVQAITGGKTFLELALAREDALKNIPGPVKHIYGLLRQVLFPYTTLMLLVIANKLKTWWWKLVFLASFGGNLIMAGATLEKSPAAAFMIMLCVTWLLLKSQEFSLSRLTTIVAVSLGFPMFVVFALYQFNIELIRVFNAIADRLLFVPANVLFYYFDYVPNHQDFLLGRTLPFVGKLFPEGFFQIANAMCLYIFPDAAIQTCNSNAAYPGYLWADFGWFGIVIGSLICGIILQGIQVLIMGLPKSAPTLALQAMLIYQVVDLSSTSLPGFLLSTGAAYEILLTVLLLALSATIRTNRVASWEVKAKR